MPRAYRIPTRGELFQREVQRQERLRLQREERERVRIANERLREELRLIRQESRRGLVSGRYGADSNQQWFKAELTRGPEIFMRGPFRNGKEAEDFFFVTKIGNPFWRRYPDVNGLPPIHDGYHTRDGNFDVKMADRIVSQLPPIGSIVRFRMSAFQRNNLQFLIWAVASHELDVAYYVARFDSD